MRLRDCNHCYGVNVVENECCLNVVACTKHMFARMYFKKVVALCH